MKGASFKIDLYFRVYAALATLLRRFWLHEDCVVVGVTGSCGKTMTKEVLASILALEYKVERSLGTQNTVGESLLPMLKMKTDTRYFVQEFGAFIPGRIAQFASAIRPQVGVVTTVGWDHYRAFRGPDGVAEEKADLIRSLPAEGLAVLNADDPRVYAMGAETKARVITYGSSKLADFRASNITCRWPDRLAFDVDYRDEFVHVSSRFCADYLLPNVLAALATGVALGAPLAAAAAEIACQEPFFARMQPVRTTQGIWFVRDDWKAPYWTLSDLVRFVSQAIAPRKILVLGQISDRSGSTQKYMRVVREAADAADMVILIGDQWNISSVRSFVRTDSRCFLFEHIQEADALLHTTLEADDLVVLKGNSGIPLSRLMLSWERPVSCWKTKCRFRQFCDYCPRII